VPDPSRLPLQTGGSAGQMLLEVTGRAGVPGAYAYRTLLVSLQAVGILTDSYYSEYELPDRTNGRPSERHRHARFGSRRLLPMNQVQVEYNYTNQNNVTTTYGPMALSDALCKYHTYDENTFIDSLGTVVNPHATGGNLMASAFNPYYGPYYDTASTPLTYTVPNTPGWPNAGATISISRAPGSQQWVTRPCSNFGVGIYDGSVSFNGTAYTNDQFWLCSSGPHFNGTPPLESGAPTLPCRTGTTGKGRCRELSVLIRTTFLRAGSTIFYDGSCGSPTPNGVGYRQPRSLGNRSTFRRRRPASSPTLTGPRRTLPLHRPTMIEFVKGGTMNVWSPLSQKTEPNYSSGTAASCGTFSPSTA